MTFIRNMIGKNIFNTCIKIESIKKNNGRLNIQMDNKTRFIEFLKKNDLQIIYDNKKGIQKRVLSGKCQKCDGIVQKAYRQFQKTGCFCWNCINFELRSSRIERASARRKTRFEKENETGVFLCPRCKENKPLSENTRQKQNKRLCITCTKHKNDDDKYFAHIIRHAYYRNQTRNENGRQHEFNIDEKYIQELYHNMYGKCDASGMKMELKSTSDWQCSIDRIDNSKGYIRGNVRLVCLEFQHGRYQWDTDLYRTFCSLYMGKTTPSTNEKEFILQKIKEAKNTTSFRLRKIPIFVEGKNQCNEYGIIIDKKNYNNKCRKCSIEYQYMRRHTLRGYLIQLLNSSKNRTKQRNIRKTSHRRTDNIFDLSLDFLFELYLKQAGRCFYTGICMMICGPFKISLERLDPLKGYSVDNVVLICDIFNTGSFIANSNDTSRGSSNWNNSKIKMVEKEMVEILKPIVTTCFDIFNQIITPIDKTSTQLSIDAIIDYFQFRKKWCTDKNEIITENGVKMYGFIRNLRRGGICISQEQRHQLLSQDCNFFDKKRTIFRKYNMTQKVSLLINYYTEHHEWPPNSYRMTDGFRLGLFKVNTQRSHPKTMSDVDKQKILLCEPNFFKN